MRTPRQLIRLLGPGLITGAGDDDPSGIGTLSQTGAHFGYTFLWTALFTTPFMMVLQEMSARIGMLTGKGPAAVMRSRYSWPVLFTAVALLFIANTVNIGVDLGAMADAARLLWPLPFPVWLVGITILSLVLEIVLTYRNYAKVVKVLTLSLFAYVITGFTIQQHWNQVLHSTFVPSVSLNRAYLMNLVAVLGSTVSPYIVFWQADEEVEEGFSRRRIPASNGGAPRITRTDIRDMRIDVGAGMIFANLVMFFIILTAAGTLGVRGIRDVHTAAEAALALRPIAGSFASVIFALGIVGTGLLAVPLLAGSASYAVAGALEWRSGLYRRAAQARGFYGVITLSMFLGALIDFTPTSPFRMLYYSAILNGLLAPPLVILFVQMSNDPSIVGSYTNSRTTTIMGWLIAGVMALAATALIASWFSSLR